MGPINYNIEAPDVLGSLTQGFSLSQGLQQLQKQRALQQQYQADLQSYSANPSAQGAAALALKYPQQREAVKQSWDTLQESERQDQGKIAGQVYAALNAGRSDIATRVLQQRHDALTNSGKDASAERSILDMIATDPKAARSSVGLILAQTGDPKAFATQYAALGKNEREVAQLPGELAKTQAEIAGTQATTQKTQAEAGIKQYEAQNAPTRIALENENAQSIIEDRAFNQRVKELDTQIAQANSETQRGQLVLERDKLIATQGEKQRTEANATQEVLATVQDGRDAIQRIRSHPALDGYFTGAGTIYGKVSGLVPGTDRRDLEALVDTLKSQQFLAGVAKLKSAGGAGALSDAEGKKIDSAIASISLDMSPRALKNALGVIDASLSRLEKSAVGSGKLSTSNKSFVLKSPTYGNITEGQINQLLQQNPGSTRDQAIQFLTQGGGAPGGASGGY